jgi:hypothetical protein
MSKRSFLNKGGGKLELTVGAATPILLSKTSSVVVNAAFSEGPKPLSEIYTSQCAVLLALLPKAQD